MQKWKGLLVDSKYGHEKHKQKRNKEGKGALLGDVRILLFCDAVLGCCSPDFDQRR